MKIIVEIRSNDYKAYLENHPEIWGCGQTPNQAIGDCVQSHPEAFGITFSFVYENKMAESV